MTPNAKTIRYEGPTSEGVEDGERFFMGMKITEIAFSCYPVTDMARARKFYEDVLGLKATNVTGEPELGQAKL